MKTDDRFDAQSWDSMYDEPTEKKIKYEDDVEETEVVYEQEDIYTDNMLPIDSNVPVESMNNEQGTEKNDNEKKKKLKIIFIAVLSVALLIGLIFGIIHLCIWFGDSNPEGGNDGSHQEYAANTLNNDADTNNETSGFEDDDLMNGTGDESLASSKNDEITGNKTDSPIFSDEITNENIPTNNNSEFPDIVGLKEDDAMKIISDYVDKYYPNSQEQGGYIDTIYSYKNEDNNMPKGYVYDCEYNGAICINVYVSMGDGEEAWSPWSETIDVPNGYVSTGYGSPYEVYSKAGFNDIEVEESVVHERRRIVYKDNNENIVRTEVWSEWEVSDCWYPFNEGEEYVGYDENTGYSKYYQTQKNKVFYRWRYCETYH